MCKRKEERHQSVEGNLTYFSTLVKFLIVWQKEFRIKPNRLSDKIITQCGQMSKSETESIAQCRAKYSPCTTVVHCRRKSLPNFVC